MIKPGTAILIGFISILLVSVSTSVKAEEAAKVEKKATEVVPLPKEWTPEIATIDVHNDFDYSLVYQQVRVQFPGMCDKDDEDVVLKIVRLASDQTEKALDFIVPIDDRGFEKVYQFGLPEAQPGRYGVKVCVADKCSPMTKSLTTMPEEGAIGDLTCKHVIYDQTTKQVVLPDVGTFNVSLPKMPKFATGQELTQNKAPEWIREHLATHCKNRNPCYAQEQEKLYVAYYFDGTQMKELFTWEKRDEINPAGKVKVASEYCMNKYYFINHVHLIDPETNEVKYKFKTQMNPNYPRLLSYFIFNTRAPKIPVELSYITDIADGKYTIWVTLCATDKDTPESTICGKPTLHNNFVVKYRAPVVDLSALTNPTQPPVQVEDVNPAGRDP